MVNAISKYRGISFPRSISNVGSQHVPNIIRRQTPLKLIYYFYISSGLRLHLGMVGNQHDKVPMLGFCAMSYFCPELLSDLVWQTGKCITQLSLQEDLLQTESLVGHSSTSISSSGHTEQRLERNEPKC